MSVGAGLCGAASLSSVPTATVRREGESTGSLLDLPIFEIEQSLLETLTAMTSSLLYSHHAAISFTQNHQRRLCESEFADDDEAALTLGSKVCSSS